MRERERKNKEGELIGKGEGIVIENMGVARIFFRGEETFRKFSKNFLRKLRKMQYFSIFSKKLTNLR